MPVYNDARTTMVAYLDVVLHHVLDVSWDVPGETGPHPKKAAATLPDLNNAASLYPSASALAEWVRSIECFTEVCVVVKCPGEGDKGKGCGRSVE